MEYIPDKLNKYQILKIIGSGGFSVVYKAFDIINNRECALKKIIKKGLEKGNKNDYMKNCILREIEIMKICKCKNVVEIYDSFETKDSFILVLELCDITLRDYMKSKVKDVKQNKVDLLFIQNIFLDLNNAFKIMYNNKIIHRDIKPDNIFLKFEGDNIIPKLGDFGISRSYNDANKNEAEDKLYYTSNYLFTNQMGTFHYMAPEILKEEKYDYKCDLFSLGVTLYELFFFEYPFNGNHIALIKNMFKKKIFKKSGLKSLDDLLEGLLKVDPKERITMEDYLNHKFFKEDKNVLNNAKIENILDKEKEKDQIIDNMEKKKLDKLDKVKEKKSKS